MLRYALRRLLVVLPTLLGISIITFLFLSYVPDHTDDPELMAGTSAEEIRRLRRQRFVDLPRFINSSPVDCETRTQRAVDDIVEGTSNKARGEEEIARLGGAALPHILPRLDTLAPRPRVDVALALAPVARRMGLSNASDAANPDRAVEFWSQFWEDRGVEFRQASVRTAVERLARYRTRSRAEDLHAVDTFALESLFEALERPTDAASVERARILVEVAAHATERDDRIPLNASVADATAVVERWLAFWNVYRSDFVVYRGASRVGAMVVETRYGRWALGLFTTTFTTDEQSVLRRMATRAPVTLAILFGGIAIAYGIAIVLGAVSAASRGRKTDLLVAVTVLFLYTMPTAFLAVIAAGWSGKDEAALFVPMLVVAAGLVASPTRQQRAALAHELAQDYCRTALAKGASRFRTVMVHGLRNALLPVATLATVEPPLALGGAFVVEHVFGLQGLGEATIAAVLDRDVAWLMALSLAAAGAAAVGVVATDITYATLDPRLRGSVLYGKRR